MRVEMQDYHIQMDQQDPLTSQRNAFYVPEHEGKDALYPRCCTCPSADAIAECSSAPAIE